VDIVEGGGWLRKMYLFVDNTQIEHQHTPMLHLDVIRHSTDSMDSILA
jgi:hypothetical protein